MELRLKEYLAATRERFAERSFRYAALQTGLDLFNSVNFTITSRYPFGKNIFSEEWDLAIVLDACRVDAMKQVEDEYDFIGHVDGIWSVGSASHEWTTQTFHRKYIDEFRRTAFLSSNPFSHRTLIDGKTPPYDSVFPFGSFAWQPIRREDLAYYEHVSSDGTKFDDTVPPWKVTDRLIAVGREEKYSRVLAHYFQPHRPFLTRTEEPMVENDLRYDYPYDMYERGELTYDELWDAYLDNLRAVLDCVGVLLENFDAERVIMTADHGQLIGELGITGHPGGVPLPQVKRVPWVELSASDEGTYTPRAEYSEDTDGIEDRLRNLGYI
jgi:hypothetical protein